MRRLTRLTCFGKRLRDINCLIININTIPVLRFGVGGGFCRMIVIFSLMHSWTGAHGWWLGLFMYHIQMYKNWVQMNTHSRRCIPDILNVCSSRADSRQIILFHRSKGHCSGCTSLLCIVEHRRPTCAVAIHNTCADQQRNRFQNSALVKDQRSMCWQHTINPPKLGH